MLQPGRVKHTKVHKGKGRNRVGTVASRGTTLSFGSFGLKAIEGTWLKASQIESARRAMARFVARGGKIWTRVFPDKPRTAKSGEVGLGGGRGALSHFVAPVQPGRILFEIDGLSEEVTRQALRLAAHKLPIKTRVVKREM